MGIAAAAAAAASVAAAGSSMFAGSGGGSSGSSPAVQQAQNAPKPPSGGQILTPGAGLGWSTGMGGDVYTNVTPGPGLAAYYAQAPGLGTSLGGMAPGYAQALAQWQAAQAPQLAGYQGSLAANRQGFVNNLAGATNTGLGYNTGGFDAAMTGLDRASGGYDYMMAGNQYAPLVAYNAQARAGMSTLRDSLRTRGVLGSSFGNAQLSGADAQYGLGAGQLAASLATQDLQNRMALAGARSGAYNTAGATAYGELGNQANALYQAGAQEASDVYGAQTAFNQSAYQNAFASMDQQRQLILDQVNILSQMAGMDLSSLAAATGFQGPMVAALTDYSKSLTSDAARLQGDYMKAQSESAKGTGQFLGSAVGALTKSGNASKTASNDNQQWGGIDSWINGLFNSGPTQLSGPVAA